MSQPGTWGSFTSGPKTPTEVATQQNETFNAILSGHVGASRPAYAVANTVWWKDTGVSPKIYEQYVYDGVADVLMGTFDVAAGTWTPVVPNNAVTNAVQTFTKTQTWTKGVDVASAASLTLGDGNYFDVTGTTTVTAIGTKGTGTAIKLHFDAALTLTHNATSLVLPGAADITTAAGDEAEFVEYSTGNWRCVNYSKADGKPIIGELLYETEVTGSAVTNIDVTGLDLDADKSYYFEMEYFTPVGAGGSIRIYANGDYTDSNYHSQSFTVDNTTVAGGRINASDICFTGATGRLTVYGNISYSTSRYFSVLTNVARDVFSSSPIFHTYTVGRSAGALSANLTSLRFACTTASGIGVGTKLRIYKRI